MFHADFWPWLSLMEQAAKLMHPKQAAKEEDALRRDVEKRAQEQGEARKQLQQLEGARPWHVLPPCVHVR